MFTDRSKDFVVFTSGIVPYDVAIVQLEQYYTDVLIQKSPNVIWFLEHPLIYTVGNGCHEVSPDILPIYKTKRGGQVTHHGPGQLIIYFAYYTEDVRRFIQRLENMLIDVLAQFNLKAYANEGIWISGEKIASIGLHVRKKIVTHGIALNINPDLSYFDYIIPCGLKDCKMTSLERLGVKAKREEVQKVIVRAMESF